MTNHPVALTGYPGVDPAEIVIALDPASGAEQVAAQLARLAPEWHTDAACRGADNALFFPPPGSSAAAALEICGRCPVRAVCLDEAIADPGLDHGVRGGLTAKARKSRRRLLAKVETTAEPLISCGPSSPEDPAFSVLCEPKFPESPAGSDDKTAGQGRFLGVSPSLKTPPDRRPPADVGGGSATPVSVDNDEFEEGADGGFFVY